MRILWFTAEWCGPCKQVSKYVDDFDGVYKIDVDEEKELAEEWNVRGIPTFIKVDENGEEISRRTGASPKSRFADWYDE